MAVRPSTYNAGSGDDRTLATGNIDWEDPNAIQLWSHVTADADIRAIVVESRIEAWFGDRLGTDAPGEAAFLISLDFDAIGTGVFSTAETLNGGQPVTTGLVLSPGSLDGNGAAGVSFASGLVELSAPIPANSHFRLVFDAQGVGATQRYLFGVDDVLFRVFAPGDTDGNGDVNSNDLFAILGADKFNHPELGPATWREGEYNGDDLVTSADIFLILAANHFNQGPTPPPHHPPPWQPFQSRRRSP